MTVRALTCIACSHPDTGSRARAAELLRAVRDQSAVSAAVQGLLLGTRASTLVDRMMSRPEGAEVSPDVTLQRALGCLPLEHLYGMRRASAAALVPRPQARTRWRCSSGCCKRTWLMLPAPAVWFLPQLSGDRGLYLGRGGGFSCQKGSEAKKQVSVPKIDLHFWAPLISFNLFFP